MCKRNILFYSVLALALASTPRVGLTQGGGVSVSGFTLTYATENFPGQDGIAVPGNPISATETEPGVLTGGATINFKLSDGKFASAPSASITGGETPLTLISNTATLSNTNKTASFTVASPSVGSASTVTLNSVSLSGVGTVLNNSANQIKIGVSVTPNTLPVTGSPQSVAASQGDYNFSFNSGNSGEIDVANGGAGQQFRNGTINQLFWTLGNVKINASNGYYLIDGSTSLTAGTNDGTGAKLSGDTSAFASVYLIADDTLCAATAPSGALLGTLTATGATFTGLVDGITYNICVVANGTSIIPAATGINIFGSAAYKIQPSVTFAPRTVSAPSNITYTPSPSTAGTNGSDTNTFYYNGAVATFNYMVGSVSGYTGLIRAANTGRTDATLYAVVRRDDGTLFNNLKLTTSQGNPMPVLKAGTTAFYTAVDFQQANGGTPVLTADQPRATVTLLSSSLNTSFIDLLSNPNGTVNLLDSSLSNIFGQ